MLLYYIKLNIILYLYLILNIIL